MVGGKVERAGGLFVVVDGFLFFFNFSIFLILRGGSYQHRAGGIFIYFF